MNRSILALLALAAVAIVALSFMFLIKPKMDDAAELRAEAEDIRAQQSQVRSQIAALEEVRSTSPDLEAELAAVSAIVPETPALPAALRQLQVAADDSGVTLVSVAPGEPASVGVEGLPGLSSISVNLQLTGGYFQVVDFLRRIENPVITARGILVQNVSVTPEEYPTLSVTVTGTMFSILEQPAEDQAEPAPTETETPEGDTDVDVDVDVTEEDAA